jgi:hypothetical protein
MLNKQQLMASAISAAVYLGPRMDTLNPQSTGMSTNRAQGSLVSPNRYDSP